MSCSGLKPTSNCASISDDKCESYYLADGQGLTAPCKIYTTGGAGCLASGQPCDGGTSGTSAYSAAMIGWIVACVIFVIAYVCLLYFGWSGYTKIPDSNPDKKMSLIFAILGIFIPLFEVGPIVVAQRT